MLPPEVVRKLFSDNDILGLLMTKGGSRRIVYFHIDTAEEPNDLTDFSIGSASALSATGTGWSEIQDSSNRYHLEPAQSGVIYQFFIGVSPGQARVYRRYPTNVDLNSLISTRAIGDPVGYIDGWKSPYRRPSPQTEMFAMYGLHPSFLGYNPYSEPASINVRLNFFVVRYNVTLLGLDPGGAGRIVSDENRLIARVRPVGGHNLLEIPTWVESAVS